MEWLGGSYGIERLAFYQMKPEMYLPETMIWEWPGPYFPWKTEWNHFLNEINIGDFHSNPGLLSTQKVHDVIETSYQQKNSP